GLVAIDAGTSSPDPLQAELIGLSLAVRPGEACYIPIGHRANADDLFEGARLAPIDDAMLLSYTLDAGLTGDDHSLDTLSQRFLGHKPVPIGEVAGSGRNFLGLARARSSRSWRAWSGTGSRLTATSSRA